MTATTASADAAQENRDHSRAIGAVLVAQGCLDAADVERINRYAQEQRMRFGDAAISMGMLSPRDVALALSRQFNDPIFPRESDGGVSREIVAAYEPQSDLVEALRALRSRLTLGILNGLSRKVLAIVSADRKDGRSWLAANLALVFAQLGDRTLLIDADLRQPRQDKLFGLNDSAGLSALLSGRAGKVLLHGIHPQLNLFVLPAGTVPPNPQQLLARPIFDLALNRFAKQFDVVILDTPAASSTADAQVVAAKAGAAIFVTRKDHSRHSSLRAAMDDFSQTGVTVLGSVINEF